jgi:hypothetical protein
MREKVCFDCVFYVPNENMAMKECSNPTVPMYKFRINNPMDYAPTTCKTFPNGWKSIYEEDENTQ